jgi:hypothetical protein
MIAACQASQATTSVEPEEAQPDPETLEDFYVDEAKEYWLSEDHLFELQTARDEVLKAPPPLDSWHLREPTSELDLTVAKARRLACWEQGKAELDLHRRNISSLPPVLVPISSPTERVYQEFLFGSTSRLCRLFCHKLELTPEQYLRLLVIYVKSC